VKALHIFVPAENNSRMRNPKKAGALIFTGAVALALAFGIYQAAHSPLFLVQVVELPDQPDHAPVDAQEITRLAAVPVGHEGLFDLDLKVIEQRILKNEWIREVRLQKRFPQTLSISVVYRDPQALFQGTHGALSYVDSTGKVFGRVNLLADRDWVLFSGFSSESDPRILDALKLLKDWDASKLGRISPISEVQWDETRGFRVWVVYGQARTSVDLGQEIGEERDSQFQNLLQVFRYLSQNSIAASQIWADSGKKIVVRTARRS
jgi:cell division septal protein FtsQ